jgi:hypothetical protein
MKVENIQTQAKLKTRRAGNTGNFRPKKSSARGVAVCVTGALCVVLVSSFWFLDFFFFFFFF